MLFCPFSKLAQQIRVIFTNICLNLYNNIIYIFITYDNDCTKILKAVVQNRRASHKNSSGTSHKSRHCSNNVYSMLISKDCTFDFGASVDNIKRVVLKMRCLPLAKGKDREISIQNWKPVFCRGEIYLFGGNNKLKSVERYSAKTESWQRVADLFDFLEDCCARASMGSVFLLGGSRERKVARFLGLSHHKNFCRRFDARDNKWKRVARMNGARSLAEGTIFEGKLVVTGGYNNTELAGLKTVESYDHVSDSWSQMPDTIERRRYHRSVSVRNKLFVVGRESCEVFDSCFRKFVLLKPKPSSVASSFHIFSHIFSIGSNIFILGHGMTTALCYDFESEEWSDGNFAIVHTSRLKF